MATAGLVLLYVAFAAALAAIVALVAGAAIGRGESRSKQNEKAALAARANSVARIGRIAVVVSAAALLACCTVLVFCFMTGDVSILYVLEERSLSTDGMAWLYRLSGLWAGRAGSLLFWTFLIGVFNTIVVLRARKQPSQLDDMAAMVVEVVIAAFVGVLLFSSGNMPFEPTPARYFTTTGELTASASLMSMNQLLEHWAMAIHPPLLFVGYAGLTVPFGYAIAALVVNDSSARWVNRATRFVLASWLFLGAGIGLGAVWAYVVLGWGGYWGWDPVENASLLSWLICVALVHTFTVYRQRGAFKRWGVMCACLAFTFVIVATFITRSGIVQSVHAFAGDPVSLALFGGLIAASLAVAVTGIVVRWKQFGPDTEGADDVDNMFSKDAAYYFNNVIMVLFALLLTYMTLASALPSFLPFGGEALSATAYEAIARPLGVLYLLILAVCPLLAWGHTDTKKFLRQARIPAVCALVLFAVLMVYWATNLRPAYYATIEKGGMNAMTLTEAGPAWYYNGLAVVGLLVASLLFFNAAFMFVRNIRAKGKRGAAIGGAFAHTAMAVILIGLIGSSMYVIEQTGYMPYDEASGTASETFNIQEYELRFSDESITDNIEANNTVLYQVVFDVYKDGQPVGQAAPSVQLDVTTQQQKLNAAVISFPDEDLFVVYRGVNQQGDFSLDVRVNPFVQFVWVGFAMLMLGTLAALVMPRRKDGASEAATAATSDGPSA